RLENSLTARARSRRVHRLVQRRPLARLARGHPAARVRTAAASAATYYARQSDGVTQQPRSPSEPVRLSSLLRAERASGLGGCELVSGSELVPRRARPSRCRTAAAHLLALAREVSDKSRIGRGSRSSTGRTGCVLIRRTTGELEPADAL